MNAPPPNVVGFEVNTSSWDKDTPQITGVPRYSGYSLYDRMSQPGAHLPDRDDEAWYAREVAGEHMDQVDEDDEFLAENLHEFTQCGWCSNSLSLQFNTVRDGWMVHCTYCGASGPSESTKQSAIDGFIGFANL